MLRGDPFHGAGDRRRDRGEPRAPLARDALQRRGRRGRRRLRSAAARRVLRVWHGARGCARRARLESARGGPGRADVDQLRLA